MARKNKVQAEDAIEKVEKEPKVQEKDAIEEAKKALNEKRLAHEKSRKEFLEAQHALDELLLADEDSKPDSASKTVREYLKRQKYGNVLTAEEKEKLKKLLK